MPAQFKISIEPDTSGSGSEFFTNKLTAVTVVVDSDSVEEDTMEDTPPMGPEDIDVSPAVIVNTAVTAAGPVASGSEPDVTIVPTAISTTGQAPRVYRTQRAGIIMTWSEAVTGFVAGDVRLRVVNSRLQAISGVSASLVNFSGSSATYSAEVVFPARTERERGVVEVSILQNAAESVMTMNEGPPAQRTIYLEWAFDDGIDDRSPTVEIRPPVGNPVIPTNNEATIGFLWNQPIGLGDFTVTPDAEGNRDVLFVPVNVTMEDLEPADFGDIRAEENRYFEGTLTLPASDDPVTVTVAVRANAASNALGLSGPSERVIACFTYQTPSTGTLDDAPSGTTLICSADYTVARHNWLDSGGGAFFGVSDLTLADGNLYGVVQIRKQSRERGERNMLDPELEAGCALFHANVNQRGGTCTAVEAYNSILQGPRSLIGVGNTLYFFTGSHYAYIHGRGTEINDEKFGRFFSYQHPASEPTDLGTAWRSRFGRDRGDDEQPDYGVHNTTASPIRHDGTSFHLVAGYGSTDTLQLNPNRRYLFIRAAEQPDSPFENRIPQGREENFAARYKNIPVIGDIIGAFQEPEVRKLLVGRPPILYDESRSEFLNIEPWSDDIPPDDGNQLWAQEVELSRTVRLPSGRTKVVVRRTESSVIVRDFYETRDEPYNTETERYPIGVIPEGIPVRPVGSVGQVSADSPLVTASEGDLASTFVANWQWLNYASHIEPFIAFLPTNEVDAWDILLQLARITHSILLFFEDQVFFKPRLPAQAELSANLSATQTDLFYRDPTRPLPANGTLVIEDEVIGYTSRGDTNLSLLTRAQEYTLAASHCSGRKLTLVDHVLTDDRIATPVNEIQVSTDFPNLYNQVEVRYADDEVTHFQEKEASVDLHGPRTFTIDANLLTTHQVEWVEWLAQVFLDTFGELQHLIDFEIDPNFEIEVGDYIYLKLSRDDIRRIGQVVNITQNPADETTAIQLRTITP